MALRKIKNQPSTLIGSPITIYYDSDYSEYQVKIKGQPDATYFTDDKDDAIATAQRMRNSLLKQNPVKIEMDGFAKQELQTIASCFDKNTMTVKTAKSRAFGYLGIDVKARTKDGFLKELYEKLQLKKNPAPKRKTSARTQSAAEAYVRRPSQITKKAPTPRLKKRRTINLQTPRGVFPNPAARQSGVIVQCSKNKTAWKNIATFPPTKEGAAHAIEYAKAYNAKMPSLYIRVMEK